MRIRIDNLSINLGGRQVVQSLSTDLSWSQQADDRVIAIMGPSGSGKTTIARHILDCVHSKSASQEVIVSPVEAVVAYLPQEPVLFAHLSLVENARLLERVGHYRDRFDIGHWHNLVDSLKLDHLLASNGKVTHLSGGEAQRIMLLRTLSVRPDLLILDEPASGLDPVVRETFLIDLQTLLERQAVCALYITHHWDEAKFLAKQVAYAQLTEIDGPIRELRVMPRDEFLNSPPTIDAFKTVYGPGCSVWPTVDGELACLKPPFSGGHSAFVRTSNDFRIALATSQRIDQGETVQAALYRKGSFMRWQEIGRRDLAEWH